MRDGMHQVRLAQTDATIQKQRVERHGPTIGDTACGRMGQFIGLADDKGIKRKPCIQRRAGNIVDIERTRDGFRRGFRHGLRNGGHLELQALHIFALLAQVIDDLITEILGYIIADEIGGHMEHGDTISKSGKFQWFDPVGIVVNPKCPLECQQHLCPDIVRHSFFTLTPRNPTTEPHPSSRCHISAEKWQPSRPRCPTPTEIPFVKLRSIQGARRKVAHQNGRRIVTQQRRTSKSSP
jgi:hypothetical protein